MTLSVADLRLIPAPRHVDLIGGWIDLPLDAAPVESIADPAIESSTRGQSYTLSIPAAHDTGSPRPRITAHSPAGLRHARATLAQLRRRFGSRLPALLVRDEPSFAIRGVMLDVSRDRIPTAAEFHRILDLLASLKFNHLQLYTEHTFAYPGHEDAWRGCSPLTPDETRDLDRLASQRGITLAANQNCFGHLARWLRLPRYAPLAETHGDWMFDAWPRSGPFSLCPTDPASLAFVEDLLDHLLPCFSSRLVNIGCDETYDVGAGRSRDAVASRGRAAVYAEFVAAIARAAERRGFRPMFWADIALSNPDALRLLPPDLIALAWGYEPDVPFARWLDTIQRASPGREAWVCPGTSSWRSITGRRTERRGNLTAAARDGLALRAPGFLLCDWGDTGHHQQWPVAALAIAHGAHAAWNAPAADAFDPRAAALHALLDAPDLALADALGPWLDDLGDADLPLRQTCLALSRPGHAGPLRNQSALFIDLHNHRGMSGTEVGEPVLWADARDRLRAAAATMPPGLPEPLASELRHTLDVALFAADRAVLRRAPGGLIASARRSLADRARAILDEHRRLWLLRSRPGGLDASSAHYQRVIDDLAGAG